MKRKFLLTAITVVVLASCSQDNIVEVNKGKTIFFRTSLDKNITRSNEKTLSNLEKFYVTAVIDNENYFKHEPIISKDQGETWKSQNSLYWPQDQPEKELEFYACNLSDENSIQINDNDERYINFTPKSSVKDQQDLLIAFNTGSKKENEDSGIQMNFKHALSQIEIKAKCSNKNVKIKVLGVKLVNISTGGTFIFSQNKITEANWAKNIKNEKDHTTYNYVIKGEKAIELGDKETSIMFGENNFMLIPQKQTKWDPKTTTSNGSYISVLCNITTTGDRKIQLYPKRDGLYGFTAVAVNIDWEPGMKYTYILDFCGEDGGGGLVDPDPTDPTDPNDPNIDKETGISGDKVLGSPIKFNVKVEEWESTDHSELSM